MNNIKITHKKFLCIALILVSIQGFSQINFFTSESFDSLSNNFYSRNSKITCIALGNYSNKEAGAAFVIHNTEDKISYIIGLKTNIPSRYIITGNEIGGTGIQQKKIPYRILGFDVGIARGVTRNWMIFATSGFVAQKSYFENSTSDLYAYSIPNHGMWYNLNFGGMYISNNNLSFLAGMDILKRTINIGIGYTW